MACASVIYPGGLENLRLMVRHVGAETTVTRDLVLRGGSGADTITDGCWVDDAADAFPATAPPGLPLTGTWVPDKPLASFAEAGVGAPGSAEELVLIAKGFDDDSVGSLEAFSLKVCYRPGAPPKPHLARVECPTTDGTPPRVCLYRSDRPPRMPCCTTCESGSCPAAAAPVVTADPPTIDLLGP